jgi:hypothetical protein
MKTHRKPPPHVIYWVNVPLRFTYRSLPDRQIIDTHIRHVDLPILSQHRREIERLVTEAHLSAEQALTSLINQQSEEMREQFEKEEPDLQVSITVSGELTYSKDLLEHLKP